MKSMFKRKRIIDLPIWFPTDDGLKIKKKIVSFLFTTHFTKDKLIVK